MARKHVKATSAKAAENKAIGKTVTVTNGIITSIV